MSYVFLCFNPNPLRTTKINLLHKKITNYKKVLKHTFY